MADVDEADLLRRHFTPAELFCARDVGRDPWCWRNSHSVRCVECAHWSDHCRLGLCVSDPTYLRLCGRYRPREE
jgi:hypothetical protein